MPKRKRKRRWFVRVFIVLAVLWVILHLPRDKVRIQVGPDTTVLSGPLNADGTVNYVAAMDMQSAEGVTRENNAAALLVEALGDSLLIPRIRDESLRTLGISAPDPCAILVTWDDWATANLPPGHPLRPTDEQPGEIFRPIMVPPEGVEPNDPNLQQLAKSFGATVPQPPTVPNEEDLLYRAADGNAVPPEIARWLAANTAALDKVVRASRRPQLYVPLASSDDPPTVANMLMPGFARCRSACRALLLRAVLRCQQGRPDATVDDILAVHRLARLAGHRPYLIGGLVGMALEELAAKTACALASSGQLPDAQVRGLLSELDGMGPAADVTVAFDGENRYMPLDVVATLSRSGLGEGDGLQADSPGWGKSMDLDWNLMLRRINPWIDRHVAATRMATFAQRQAALDAWHRDVQTIADDFAAHSKSRLRNLRILRLLGWPTRAKESELVADFILCTFIGGLGRARVLQDRAEAWRQLERCSLALAAFRTEHAGWPASLDQLVPKYLPAVPADPFTDKPLQYRPSGGGYVLYSFGTNATDDGGREIKGYDEGDLVVRGRAGAGD